MMNGFVTRAMPINEVMDELTYRSYAAQRFMFPETPAEDWARIFGDTSARIMEARLQRELMGSSEGDA